MRAFFWRVMPGYEKIGAGCGTGGAEMSEDGLVRAALEILARVPDAPPDPGDELPLTDGELRALRAVGVDPDPGPVTGERVPLPATLDPDLPGLDRVRSAARPDLPEVALAGFLATPQPDLEAEGGAVTPADWLRSGRDPGAVARLARGL